MAPLGYLNNRETKQIYVDKEKSPFIKKAFEAYASGKYTLKEIRKIINGLGLRGRRDKMLSVSNYQYLLQNPFYYGLIRYNGEYFEGKHEPIIAKKLFNQCQEVMKQKSKPQKVDEMKFFLYRGFFHCGECGFTITADKKIKPSEKEYTYYYCTKKNPNHICSQNVFTREEKISSQINEAIQKVSLPDDWADKMLNELENEKNEKAQSSRFFAQKIQDEIEVVDEKLEKLMNAYLENALSLAEYREVKNKLVNQKQFLKDKLTAFEQKSDNRFELATRFINTIKQAEIIALQENPEQGRDFLKKIGSNFRLSGQKLFLDFKFPFKITAEAELERSEGGATTLKNAEIVNWRKRRDSVTSIFSDEKISRPRLAVLTLPSGQIRTSLRLSHPYGRQAVGVLLFLVHDVHCGSGGIRTPGAVSHTLALQASAFDHSATLPHFSLSLQTISQNQRKNQGVGFFYFTF